VFVFYSGNSTTLVLGNRRWGADDSFHYYVVHVGIPSTSFPPIPWAHLRGWPGKKFSAPIMVPWMAFVLPEGDRLSKA
jgi:hypothetical protein